MMAEVCRWTLEDERYDSRGGIEVEERDVKWSEEEGPIRVAMCAYLSHQL